MYRIIGITILMGVVLQIGLQITSASVKPPGEYSKVTRNLECKIDTDCPSGMKCYGSTCYQKRSVNARKRSTVTHSEVHCQEQELLCHDKTTCATRCDNNRECLSGEDETNCTEQYGDCPDGKLLCFDFVRCAKQCNNVTECDDGEDERSCTGTACADCPYGKMLCPDMTTCAVRCNNVSECIGGLDEENCTRQCDCKDIYSLAFDCQKYTDELIYMPGKYIQAYAVGVTSPVEITSTQECQEFCANTTGCKSFEIHSDQYCFLNSITPGEAFSTTEGIGVSADYKLYVLKCAICP